jgi:hypothetical protein
MLAGIGFDSVERKNQFMRGKGRAGFGARMRLQDALML